MSVKPPRANYCATCGHHIDRHRLTNLGHGAPCNAPLGHGSTCSCKGYVRIEPPKKKAVDITSAGEPTPIPKINE